MATGIDNIVAAIPGLTAAIATENAQIDTLVSELKNTPPEDPRAQQIADQLGALTGSINAKMAQFANDVSGTKSDTAGTAASPAV